MLKCDRAVKRYSESFKLKVLTELEQGKYTKSEVQQVYGIGAGTIYCWIRKYDKSHLLNKYVRIETMNEKDKIKELEKRISELKELLIDKDLKLFVNDMYLETISEQLGYKDVEELKKKFESKRSSKQSKGGKKKD
jgi:transposase-like protein